jgi:hypothetical protein
MRTIHSKRRGCGERKQGGVYIVTEPSDEGLLPLWISLDPPIPCNDRHHRGPVLVDGQKILAKENEEAWLAGSSADRLEKQKADEWAIERFGMSSWTRLHLGETKGLTGVDEAWEHLLNSVAWNPVHATDNLENLVNLGIYSIPQVLEDMELLVRYLRRANISPNAEDILGVVAASWRIADLLPPSKRMVYIPFLMRILVAVGLTKDALAMKRRYLDG